MAEERERERQLSERREERAISPFEAEWFETPWRMIQRFRDEMDRMLGEWPAFGRAMTSMRSMMPQAMMPGMMVPSVDISETDNEVMIRADLPGVEPDNVEIYTTEDAIRIRGEVRREEEKRERGYYRTERRFGMFDRTIPLPTEIQPDQVKATFRHGVLEVMLPKTQQAKEKMRKVPIETREQMAGTKRGEAKEEKQKGRKKA